MKIYFIIDSDYKVYPCCDYTEDIQPDVDWILGELPDNSNAYEEHGIPLWKYVDGEIVHRTDAEIQADIDAIPVPEPDETTKQINSMKAQMASIAKVETSMMATENYESGQLLYINDVLYKTTKNIAKGSTIHVNGNVIATTLTEQLKAIGG